MALDGTQTELATWLEIGIDPQDVEVSPGGRKQLTDAQKRKVVRGFISAEVRSQYANELGMSDAIIRKWADDFQIKIPDRTGVGRPAPRVRELPPPAHHHQPDLIPPAPATLTQLPAPVPIKPQNRDLGPFRYPIAEAIQKLQNAQTFMSSGEVSVIIHDAM